MNRPFWEGRIRSAWTRRAVVWLMGVRRAGKTVLCQSLPGIEYFDCELPRTRRALDDPEAFLEEHDGRTIALDEIHRLDRPAELLKIAADHFPRVRLIATGSSTLGASARFRDTLAGRKEEIWLTPMTLADMTAFGNVRMAHRLARGGLPPFFLAETPPEREFQEWMDAYWAKDILELFRLERRQSFQRLFELLLAQSGGIFEATALARPTEVSRTTVTNYVAVLEATFVVHLVRPFAAGGAAEIVSAPKAYAFDTGFVAYHRGWDGPRGDELGILWEHMVLNELHAHVGRPAVRYWRSKQGHEVDFVLASTRREPTAIECKWTSGQFDPAGLQAFRRRYPKGENLVVTNDTKDTYQKRFGELLVRFINLPALVEWTGRGRTKGIREQRLPTDD